MTSIFHGGHWAELQLPFNSEKNSHETDMTVILKLCSWPLSSSGARRTHLAAVTRPIEIKKERNRESIMEHCSAFLFHSVPNSSINHSSLGPFGAQYAMTGFQKSGLILFKNAHPIPNLSEFSYLVEKIALIFEEFALKKQQ